MLSLPLAILFIISILLYKSFYDFSKNDSPKSKITSNTGFLAKWFYIVCGYFLFLFMLLVATLVLTAIVVYF